MVDEYQVEKTTMVDRYPVQIPLWSMNTPWDKSNQLVDESSDSSMVDEYAGRSGWHQVQGGSDSSMVDEYLLRSLF